MEREVALARLRPLEQKLRQQGMTALYLFGSTARGEADAKTQALQITRMALGSEVELLEAKARLARASGDSKAAIDL